MAVTLTLSSLAHKSKTIQHYTFRVSQDVVVLGLVLVLVVVLVVVVLVVILVVVVVVVVVVVLVVVRKETKRGGVSMRERER